MSAGGMSAPRLRALHVAALPFPTPQGTQAAIARMLAASAAAGERPTLVTYEDGLGEAPAGVRHVRVAGARGGSLRSGPSLEKLAADVVLGRALGRLARDADVVVAHHVEAALAALAAGVRPVLFVAHTALGPELPTYFSGVLEGPLGRAGDALDRRLCARADAVAAVSPLLARELARLSGRAVHPLPIPWPAAAPLAEAERPLAQRAARAALGIAPGAEVVLYAGNLDAYQGLSALGAALERLARRRPGLVFLLATESDPLGMAQQLPPRFSPRVVRARLRTEDERALVHAAASVAVVPRRSAGGLPVKLLDALARGVPTVAVRRALAGHALEGAVVLAEDDDPDALAAALGAALGLSAAERADLARRGHAALATSFSEAAFVDALRRALADAAHRA